ncbi:MAG TPA: ComF family protein [Vicinamibacterales bacterium]|nr:ComF family protein [Vicinamibacterales bacterium]
MPAAPEQTGTVLRQAVAVFGRGIDALVAVLLAPGCAACGAPLEAPAASPVCGPCWAAIVPFAGPLCARCGVPLPSWRVISVAESVCARCRRAPSVAAAAAIGAYEGALRAIVHALKYGGRRSLAPRLGALMRASGEAVLLGADAAVPVPLHRRRHRERGFNQAADLAACLGVPVLHALRRVRATPSQLGFRAAGRRANVRGAFALARRAEVAGLRLVVVDDVCTTGATLEACVAVLRDAGASEIRVITAARAVRQRLE